MIYGWILFIVVVLGGGMMLYAMSKKRALSDIDRDKVRSAWANIELLVEGDNDSEWVKAVFEADKLLDFALVQRRVAGESLGERLKNAKPLFGNIDAAWQAHKVRNELAHNMNAQLTRPQIERAMDNFKRALRRLGAL